MKCLRSKPASDVLAASSTAAMAKFPAFSIQNFEPIGPVVDGKLIIDQPLGLIKQHNFQQKPILLGFSSDETGIAFLRGMNISSLMYNIILQSGIVPLNAKEMYPSDDSIDQTDKFVSLTTDILFICSARNASQSMFAQGNRHVWMYLWDHLTEMSKKAGVKYVYHGVDVLYRFGNLRKSLFTKKELELSDNIMLLWSNFVWSGNPNVAQKDRASNAISAPAPKWPPYSESLNWPILCFRTENTTVVENYRSSFCDFWDMIGYKT